MAGAAHVGIDATVCAVSTSTLLGCLINLDVLDGKYFGVETLEESIAFCILEKRLQKRGTLFGPASLCHSPDLCLGTSSDTTIKSTEGNTLLFLLDILQELQGLLQVHVLKDHCRFTRVLEVNPKVLPASFAGFR